MSDDADSEDFTRRYNEYLQRVADIKSGAEALREANAVRDKARADAAEIKRKAAEFAEAMRRELVASWSSVPKPVPTPATESVSMPAPPEPEPQPVSTPDLDSMSMDEYAAYRISGQPASKRLGTGRYWTEGGYARDVKPDGV